MIPCASESWAFRWDARLLAAVVVVDVVVVVVVVVQVAVVGVAIVEVAVVEVVPGVAPVEVAAEVAPVHIAVEVAEASPTWHSLWLMQRNHCLNFWGFCYRQQEN